MNGKRLLPLLASFAILASACTQQNSGDDPKASDIPQGLNRFLLFPNPVAMNTGGFETNTNEYADAYYRAIDPTNAKDTIDKWKTANAFGSGTGTEKLAVFRDAKDLGYGRRMTGRMNTDGSVAFFVENYNVAPNGTSGYASTLNVEAAIVRDTRWHVGTNAIEWSAAPCSAAELAEGCNPNVKFAKYFNFSSKDGTRQVAVDLDGNGLKSMPGPCITCHGGRGDPLTPPDATGKPRFPLVENSLSRKRGDVQAHLHGMNVDSFGFSPDIAGFFKSDQQATLKQFNQWILCTYPLPAPTGLAEDVCRVTAGANEWQGTEAELIKAWYGGNGMPQANFNDLDSAGLPLYVPAGWNSGTVIPNTNPPLTDTALYKQVVAPYCRTCHILRGTGTEPGPGNRNDLDFTTLAKFQSYADRIKAHVFDRGTMPLAKIVYNDFWTSSAPAKLANFIDAQLGAGAATSGGAVLRPGRPIASPGPNRMVRTGANSLLTGEDSLFAGSFSWSQVSSNPPGLNAIISDPGSMITNFNPPAAGDYVVRLTVGNGSQSNSKDVTITANNAFPDPQSIKFAHVKNVLQNISYTTSQVTAQKCVTCHVSPATTPTPPVFYNSFDRDGSGGAPNQTDDDWFIKALIGRVNLTEIEASPLLRKPSGNHHRGQMVLDLNDKSDGGGLSSYSILYHWILAGTRTGGVAADMAISSALGQTGPASFSFNFTGPVSGPYVSPNITLNGNSSLGAAGFAWTVFGPPGPLGNPPVITNPTAASATLNVFNTGTYVVQLQANDGGSSTDTIQRTIVVGENPITASFTPTTGSQQLTFSGNPLAGSISLTSNSSGSPTTCVWEVTGPPGALLDGSTTLSTPPKSCGTSATLTVPSTALGATYAVQLTASNLASSVADSFLVVAAAPGQGAGNANFTPPVSVISFTVNGTSANPTQRRINNVATSNIALSGTATGLAPLTFTWSLPSGAGTAGCSTPASGQSTSLPVTKSGTCSVMLTVSNAFGPPSTVTKTVTVTSAVTFANVIAILGNGGTAAPGTASDCTGCHVAPGSALQPSWVTDNTPGGNSALLTRLQTKIDLGTPRNSLLLNCPNLGCDGGAMPANRPGFVNGGSMVNYDAFLTWITNGLP